jgi:glycosyltransferase
MNKGIRAATGDIVGILNSDDFYTSRDCLTRVAECMAKENVDSCYADVAYVDAGNIQKQVRYWQSGNYNKGEFKRGWMPPHPTFFAHRMLYEKYGLFNLDFKLAADYELMLRFLYKNDVSTAYIPKCLVTMRVGGTCNPGFTNTLNNISENYRAWKVNDLKPNPLTFIMKPLFKTSQYLKMKSC